jgi:serine/threonine-protein kinase
MILVLSAAAALTAAAMGAAATASADPLADLLALVPEGYGPGGCQPVTDIPANALTGVDCQNRVFPGGGPAPARYLIYGDPGALENAFAGFVNNKDAFQPLPCPDTGSIGGSKWGEPDTPAGSIACGTINGQAAVVWTKDSGPYLGAALANDLNPLRGWWVATIETPPS